MRPSVLTIAHNGERYTHTMRSARVVNYTNPDDWIEYVPPVPCSNGRPRRFEYVRGEGLLLTCGCGFTFPGVI